MQSRLAHQQINVGPDSVPFYADLMALLGWKVLYDGPVAPDNQRMLGVEDGNGTSLWFNGQVKAVTNDYDGPGLNHLGIGVTAQADVDAAAAFLQARGIAALFETPRHRPEFSGGEGQTYYQVMFETPDRLLLEVVYTGPQQA